MRKAKRTILIALLICVGFVPVCSARSRRGKAKPVPMSVSELLDKYAKTQDKLKSFRIVAESRAKGATNHPISTSKGKTQYRVSHSDYRYDGKRYSVRLDRWLNVDSLQDKTLSKNHKSYNYSRELWDGKTAFSYARDNRNQLGTLIINENRKPSKMELLPRGQMFGRFAGDVKRIDKILRQADVISLRGQMEKVGGSGCYVIDAIVKNGKYTVYLDAQHGYNIAKAEVHKEKGSHAYGRQLGAGFNISGSFEVTRFEQVDGTWIPMEARTTGESKWPGGHFSKGTTHIERISVMLNPNHDALGSFVLDDVPNGATVHIAQVPGITYTWQDGQVVDEKGQKVDLEKVKVKSKKAKEGKKRG